MAAVPTSELSIAERDELMCTYAALILHDEKLPITADNINKIIAATGAKVESYWPTLFARALSTANVGELLTAIGTPGAGAAPAGSPSAGAAKSPSAGPAKGGKAAAPAKKEEEEDAGDMGFSLFD